MEAVQWAWGQCQVDEWGPVVSKQFSLMEEGEINRELAMAQGAAVEEETVIETVSEMVMETLIGIVIVIL